MLQCNVVAPLVVVSDISIHVGRFGYRNKYMYQLLGGYRPFPSIQKFVRSMIGESVCSVYTRRPLSSGIASFGYVHVGGLT